MIFFQTEIFIMSYLWEFLYLFCHTRTVPVVYLNLNRDDRSDHFHSKKKNVSRLQTDSGHGFCGGKRSKGVKSVCTLFQLTSIEKFLSTVFQQIHCSSYPLPDMSGPEGTNAKNFDFHFMFDFRFYLVMTFARQ